VLGPAVGFASQEADGSGLAPEAAEVAGGQPSGEVRGKCAHRGAGHTQQGEEAIITH